MRSKLGSLLAAAISFGIAQSAWAADLPARPVYKAPVAIPVTPTWTGFYIGGHAGYGWSSTDWGFPVVGFYNPAPGMGFSTDPKGFMGGVHGGYNYQIGTWVFGLEASYDPTKMKQTLVGPVTPVYPTDTFTTKVGELLTVTGRIGYASANWLLYVKGGWANARVQLDAISGPPIAGVTAAVGKHSNGGTLGVGAEYMITPNIIAGVEYDWVRLQSASFSSFTSNSVPFIIGRDSTDIHMVLGRLSFKFSQ
jgi:outer membrane immunogenic protein